MSKRTIKKVILIILIILLAAAAAILILLRILAGRTNYTKDSDVSLQIETETEKPLHAADIYEIEKVKTVDEEQRKGTYALLVIGGDTPEAEAEGNREDASAVILMVVNHNLGYVYFASMRTENELSESELDAVAGGKVDTDDLIVSIFTFGIACAAQSVYYVTHAGTEACEESFHNRDGK